MEQRGTNSNDSLNFAISYNISVRNMMSFWLWIVIFQKWRISATTLSDSVKVKNVKADIALHGNPISEIRDVTCHVGSHSVTFHPTQVNTPHLNPSHAGLYLIYLPRRDGWLS